MNATRPERLFNGLRISTRWRVYPRQRAFFAAGHRRHEGGQTAPSLRLAGVFRRPIETTYPICSPETLVPLSCPFSLTFRASKERTVVGQKLATRCHRNQRQKADVPHNICEGHEHPELVSTVVREGDMMRDLQGITARGVFFVATITGAVGSTAMADEPIVNRTVQVSGTGTDLLNGAVVHSK
jgi:hypothetical protein